MHPNDCSPLLARSSPDSAVERVFFFVPVCAFSSGSEISLMLRPSSMHQLKEPILSTLRRVPSSLLFFLLLRLDTRVDIPV